MELLPIFGNSTLLIISIIMLWKCANLLVESSVLIAKKLQISEFVIGLTIVAIGTSAPEFAVSISAAISGKTNISVGNIVGSNIFNLGFILGGTACFRAIRIPEKVLWREGSLLLFTTILLYFIVFGFSYGTVNGKIDYTEGLVLLSILISYITYLLIKKDPVENDELSSITGNATAITWVKLFIGISGVLLGGHLLVESSSFLARIAGLSEWVIGVTIVAAGTSAPEFATSMAAVIKGRHGMAIGNLIGSDLFNLLGVLGIASIIRDLDVDFSASPSMALLVLMVVLVLIFMRTGWCISRFEGAVLVVLNLIRWVFDFTK